jgi:hypothetical protein
MTLRLFYASWDADDHARKKARMNAPVGRDLAMDQKSTCRTSNIGEKDALDARAF